MQYGDTAVVRWAAAALEVPDTKGVRRSVVDTLLQIASVAPLRPYIPIQMWSWLKRKPTHLPLCLGQHWEANADIVCHVRELGDNEILKSYFLLVWSGWNNKLLGLDEMKISLKEDFGGIGMWRHRKDLNNQLDHSLEQLNHKLKYIQVGNCFTLMSGAQQRMEQYGELKRVLLEVDREAMNTLTPMCIESHSTFACSLPLPCP